MLEAAECIFCEISANRIVDQNELCFVIRDGYPVTKLHSLIIPRRHIADYFDLTNAEIISANELLKSEREKIQNIDPSVTGFNIGINSGISSGQTIFHVHIHLIPRRDNDIKDPRGGVRGVIPDKKSY